MIVKNLVGADIEIFDTPDALFLRVLDGDEIVASVMVQGDSAQATKKIVAKAALAQKALEDV